LGEATTSEGLPLAHHGGEGEGTSGGTGTGGAFSAEDHSHAIGPILRPLRIRPPVVGEIAVKAGEANHGGEAIGPEKESGGKRGPLGEPCRHC
jgi:hypothetical protein